MPKTTPTADIDSLFGFGSGNDEPEYEQKDTGDEGVDSSQAGIASSKETPGERGEEASPEPSEADNQGETEEDASTHSRDERLQRIIEDGKRYRRYAPLIDLLEEHPEITAHLMTGGVYPQVAQPPAPAPTTPPAPRPEETAEYWREEIEKDPAGAVQKLVHTMVSKATAGPALASARVLVESYKNRRSREDELFPYYEGLFDRLVQGTDPRMIISSPDQVLKVIEYAAFGAWAQDQWGKAKRARQTSEVPQKRETPKPLTESKGSGDSKKTAKPKRQLTPEEQALGSRYGFDLLEDDEEDSYKSPWGG